MRRRKRIKIKNMVLKTITWIMGIIFVLSMLSLDTPFSPSWVPTITMVASMAWLALFGLANGWFEVDKPERWDF